MRYLFLAVFLSCFLTKMMSQLDETEERGDFRLMFYNVENLFDTEDDSLKNDDFFTPQGSMHWSWKKYQQKINRISQVILNVGGWEVPEIVGLCEVENRYVLEGITRYTPLAKFDYKILHFESPDLRGIDVAMLYQEKRFEPIHSEAIPVVFDGPDSRPTRDILYVEGVTHTKDTLHVFVNHWPSKYGGDLETEPLRIRAAETLRGKVKELWSKNPLAKIVIMGDLNDEVESKPVKDALQAQTETASLTPKTLYNLSARWNKERNYGSHKYQGVWSVIDHIIVSTGVLTKENGILLAAPEDAHIFKADFLLEPDEKEGGMKPFRTNIGMKYNNGFSDHLPVYLDLWRD